MEVSSDSAGSGAENAPASRGPAGLPALPDLGLSETAAPELERYAERARDLLGAPVALVSVLTARAPVSFSSGARTAPAAGAGAAGVIAATNEPLVVADALDDPLLTGGETAGADTRVRAYAGYPLTDDSGRAIGALIVLDLAPRAWTASQLSQLEDLAHDCSNELRLRLARFEAHRERLLRRSAEELTRAEAARYRLLLDAARSLNAASTEEGVRGRLERLATELPRRVTLRLYHQRDLDAPSAEPPAAVAQCARERTVVSRTGDAPLVCCPVTGSAGPLGVLELRWSTPHRIADADLETATTVAAFVAQALDRVRLIEDRVSVAHQLQSAILTTLPQLPELQLAGCYVAAAAEEWVGGDWYDALVLPPDNEHDLVVAVTVGDVIGHDIAAAALMGQARAMLRQAAFDRPGEGPAAVLTHFERACAAIGVEARGSAVLAYLERSAETGAWSMVWTSAGHPPPLLALPDGSHRRLDPDIGEQDLLFGYLDIYDGPRHNSRVDLPEGSSVLFYTDGVIEMPGTDLEEQMDELGDLLVDVHRRGPQAVVDAISMNFGTGYDDVVALAVRIPDPSD